MTKGIQKLITRISDTKCLLLGKKIVLFAKKSAEANENPQMTEKPSNTSQAQIQHVYLEGGTAILAWYHSAAEQQLGADDSAGYIVP